jgi:hypothetical protein
MLTSLRSRQADEWSLWAACLLTVGAAVVPLVVVPSGGINRIAGATLPLSIAAAALAANALTRRRGALLSGLLYAAATLAILYGLILVLSVPLRLAIQGVCQPAPASCPLGFDRPMTSAESFGVTLLVVLGALSLLFTFIAAEVEYIHRPKPRISSSASLPPLARQRPPMTPESPPPTPESPPEHESPPEAGC